jgi:hypothetical protein
VLPGQGRFNIPVVNVPKAVPQSDDPDRWRHAEIEVLSLMPLGGIPMF